MEEEKSKSRGTSTVIWLWRLLLKLVSTVQTYYAFICVGIASLVTLVYFGINCIVTKPNTLIQSAARDYSEESQYDVSDVRRYCYSSRLASTSAPSSRAVLLRALPTAPSSGAPSTWSRREPHWSTRSSSEMLYTLMRCFGVWNVTASKKHASNQFYDLDIDFVVIAGGYGRG